MSVQAGSDAMHRARLCLFPIVVATISLPVHAVVTSSTLKRHLRPTSRNSVSLVEDRAQERDSVTQRQVLGRVVSHDGQLFMNAAVPGQIWALAPDYTNGKWIWQPAGSVYGTDPALPVNPPTVFAPGPAPGAAQTAAGPAPVPAAAPGPGPAPGPGAAPGPCEKLKAKGDQTPGAIGMFLGCQEFRYYGDSVMGKTAPYGCHCASWTVNCPFETCPTTEAFDAACLSPDVKSMGFKSLSKMINYVNPASVPKGLRPYTQHPDYISTCMYWLPKPPMASLPAVHSSQYAKQLPDFATFFFDGITFPGCAEQIWDENKLSVTKAGLLHALGQTQLQVVSITCGSMSALITGPKSEIDAAARIASNVKFCFQAATLPVCTVAPSPPPAPPAAPAGGPGPAPAPAR